MLVSAVAAGMAVRAALTATEEMLLMVQAMWVGGVIILLLAILIALLSGRNNATRR